MFVLSILIWLAIFAQSGCTALAIENPKARVSAAAVARAKAIGGEGGEGPSNKDAPLRSSSRSLQDEILITATTPGDMSPEELAAMAEVMEVIEEGAEGPPGVTVIPPTGDGNQTEGIDEDGVPTSPSDGIVDPYGVPGEENGTMASIIAIYPGDNSTNETTYPEGDYTAEPTGPAELGVTTEMPPPGLDDPDENYTDTLPSVPYPEPEGEFPPGGDEEGDPMTIEGTSVPTPAGGGDNEEGTTPSNGSEEGTTRPSYNPTTPEPTEDYWAGKPYLAPTDPTKAPTDRPTALYVPKGEDPLVEEETPDIGDFSDDKIFYHGLGGKVGTYLDGVETPMEMEKDKNVQVVAGILLGVFLVLVLVTAHLVMNYPDGLCAGCCRLTLKCICCFTRTLCLPCRAICCKGSDQTSNRRTHAPMRTPFPSDLELA